MERDLQDFTSIQRHFLKDFENYFRDLYKNDSWLPGREYGLRNSFKELAMTLDDLYEERCQLLVELGNEVEDVRTLEDTTERELGHLILRLKKE